MTTTNGQSRGTAVTSEADYVTVLPTIHPARFLAVIMRWHSRDDQYVQTRVSSPLRSADAHALARSWAAAMGLETRL